MLPPVHGTTDLDDFRRSKFPMDLAVIDAGAESIDTEEVVRELHEISPNVRMLFLAADEDTAAVESTPSLGHVREILRKPFRRSQLLGRALQIMDRASALTA